MSVVIAILLMILILGVSIVVHELGHFFAARICKIKVHEFAIGMGPKLWIKEGKQTKFSLRAIPIGGFCAMAEDDGPTDDPAAFVNKPKWQRIFVLVSGSVMNFLLGFLILLIIGFTLQSRAVPVIEGFHDGYAYTQDGERVESGLEPFLHQGILQEGDRLISINGMHLFSADYVRAFLDIPDDGMQRIVIERDGERHRLEFEWRPLRITQGEHAGEYSSRYGFYMRVEDLNFGTRLTHSVNRSLEMVQIVTFSIGSMIRGQADMSEVAGPVGMTEIVHQAVDAPGVPAGVRINFLLFFAALIAVNLAVINMLPIPALDGGRVLFILIEAIVRRKIPPKVEGMIHGVFFLLLLGLIALIFYGDIARIVGRS